MRNFHRVDLDTSQKPCGYCFVDVDGCQYGVKCAGDSGVVSFMADDTHEFEMYYKDIPNMIKVLQAVYNEGNV